MPDYKLAYVRVFVTDFERAVRFYTESLGMIPGFRSDEMRWCQFQTGEASLAIECIEPDAEDAGDGADPEDEVGPRFVAVSLQVPDIDEAYQELTAKGVEFLGPPQQMPWGGMLAHFKDPDGNVLTLLG
jgi:predicted enzyme related to lactoylglutathione lyase